jgi:hypothetical protein
MDVCPSEREEEEEEEEKEEEEEEEGMRFTTQRDKERHIFRQFICGRV